MIIKRRKAALLAALSVSVLAASVASADADCSMPVNEWQLELVELELLEGEGDLALERAALGEQAILEGADEVVTLQLGEADGAPVLTFVREAP